MRSMLAVIGSIVLTVLCWGNYGALLHEGQLAMGGSRLRPFICVGLAYFFIAIVCPALFLRLRGERGNWTFQGVLWSTSAGICGSIGSLGIILALTFGGMPIYVMPIVFGGAPVINSFITIVLSKNFRHIGPIFYAGLIMVIAGAVTVLVFKPGKPGAAESIGFAQVLTTVLPATLLTVAAWGTYGSLLHKGQEKMRGSRLRPLMCVGLAYLVIGVAVPTFLLGTGLDHQPGHQFTTLGSMWALGAGAAGALGALGIILAFTFGGRPVYVMPLVFGGAPVINTFTTLIANDLMGRTGPVFFAGLILVVVGAAVVLVFAPKAHPAGATTTPPTKPAKEPATA